MIRRCEDPKRWAFRYYGARGITVCPRWKQPRSEGYANFLADMGQRPPGTTIDRINNDGNYEPSNCRWATPREQARPNRGSFKPGHHIGIKFKPGNAPWNKRMMTK